LFFDCIKRHTLLTGFHLFFRRLLADYISFEEHLAYIAVPGNGKRDISVGSNFDVPFFERPQAVEAVVEQLLIIGKVFAVIVFAKKPDKRIRLAVECRNRRVALGYNLTGI